MTIEELFALDQEDLVERIGKATIANQEFSSIDIPFPDGLALTPGRDPLEAGRRVLERIERELHDLICSGGAAEKEDRASIKAAAGLGNVTLAGTLVAVLTGTFGVEHSVAIAASAILVKYVFNPAGDELCQFWSERISR